MDEGDNIRHGTEGGGAAPGDFEGAAGVSDIHAVLPMCELCDIALHGEWRIAESGLCMQVDEGDGGEVWDLQLCDEREMRAVGDNARPAGGGGEGEEDGVGKLTWGERMRFAGSQEPG